MEAAFFDLDKTVIARASMMAFSRPLYRDGLLSRRSLLRGVWSQLLYLYIGAGEARLARIRESVLAVTTGWEQARVRAVVAGAVADVIEPITFVEALELMDSHRAAGRRLFIVSASPAELVEPLAAFFGVDEAIASRAEVDDRGRYTGRMATYAYGAQKATLMREIAERDGIDLAASYAYSDSSTDVPMLETVGHPVAVNPDRKLRDIAAQRGWEVQRFVQPVRLRDRVLVPRPSTAATIGVTVILAGALGRSVTRRQRRRTS